MKRIEILSRYLWIISEAETLIFQADKLAGFNKHKIYDPDTEEIRQYNGYIQSLRDKARDLLTVCKQFEGIIDSLDNDQERMICRKYYGCGFTDEEIGSQMNMHQSTVCRIRKKALTRLS